MNEAYQTSLAICKRHADRLAWSMSHIRFPLSAETLSQMDDTELAILDQFSTRYSKLQDAMGAKLFPQSWNYPKNRANWRPFSIS